MKEAIVHKGGNVDIVDSPIPKPGPKQVLIKIVVSGSNPKDWKLPDWLNKSGNSGDDIAGVVQEVGEEVFLFKKGDRVAAFHEMLTEHGSFAEYGIAWEHTTILLPDNVSFEEAAAIPLAALTAVVGLYEKEKLGLPEPWSPAPKGSETPLIVYGGASAVGAYAIQLAQRSNIHPIIAVAGKGIPFVEKLIDKSKGDAVIDYRSGNDAVVSGIKDALNGKKASYAFDAISDRGSYVNIAKVLEPKGRIVIVLPGNDWDQVPKYIVKCLMNVGDVHKDEYKDFGFVHFQNIARGLGDGWFKAHPYEVVKGGLEGVKEGLGNLREGKASAIKYVFRIADTPGL